MHFLTLQKEKKSKNHTYPNETFMCNKIDKWSDLYTQDYRLGKTEKE